MHRFRVSVLLLLATSIAGCGEGAVIGELRALCEKDAGAKVYKTVTARGYFDDMKYCHHCWRDLIGQPYKFVEVCVEEARPWYAIPEPGCWRLYKAERGGGECDEHIDVELLKMRTGEGISFFRASCIAKTKIEKPTARYGTFFEEKSWVLDNRKKSKFWRHITTVKETNSGDVLAEQIDYLVSPNPEGHTMRVMTRGCSYTNPEIDLHAFLINAVLVEDAN